MSTVDETRARPQLWALHIKGPDSILAMSGKAEYIATWHAVVVPWPGTAEEHAAELADDEGPDW